MPPLWCCSLGQSTTVVATPADDEAESKDGRPFHVMQRKPEKEINHAKLSKHLIVDDSSFNRLVLRRFLNIIGVEVGTIYRNASGPICLSWFRHRCYWIH